MSSDLIRFNFRRFQFLSFGLEVFSPEFRNLEMSSCKSHVRIKGLKSETGKTLNGSIGIIIKKVTGKDGKMRFKVKVRERTFALRKENLGT